MEKLLTDAGARPAKADRSENGGEILAAGSRMRTQKRMGICLLVICAMILLMCSAGIIPADQDATAVVVLAPLGMWLLLTKETVV